jgi:glycogen debranching enzyme
MDFAAEWSNQDVNDKKLALGKFINNPNDNHPDYLKIVQAPNGWGVYASDGPNFKYAIFGRDSIVVAEDLLSTQKDLARHIILTLAKLQGAVTDDSIEEEPGKIHHEFRASKYNGIEIPEYSRGILRNLQRLWGSEDPDVMIYYGGYDATPMYVRLVCKYVECYGEQILHEEYIGRDQQNHKIADSLKFAIGWITYKLNESSLGLLEYKRINPQGIENQAWKDSRTSYLRRDGSLPNFSKGVASIEIQGYVYDALLLGSKLVAETDEQAAYWQSLAAKISEKVIGWYWMDDVKYFAQALDFDGKDKRQQINTLTSNGALLLNSRLLDGLKLDDRDFYVGKIAEMISSNEFITDAGIRSRSLRHESIPGFIDYHGSYTVWHKETNEIAKGLRNHGLNSLAALLEKRMLDAVLKSGEFSEFYYVDHENKVWYDRIEAMGHFDLLSPGGNLPTPEPGQAWTISSIYRICFSGNLNKEFPVNKIEEPIIRLMPKLD